MGSVQAWAGYPKVGRVLKMPLVAVLVLVLAVLVGCGDASLAPIVQGKVFRSKSPTDGAIGISGSGLDGNTIQDVRFENLDYGLKIGAGAQSRGLRIDDVIATNNTQAIFVANLSDSRFSNLDLQSYYVPDAQSGNKNHVIYLERGNHNLTFENVTLSGGSGQTLQMYCYNNRNEPSDHITFKGLTIENANHGPIVISGGYSHVTIKNLKATATGDEFPVIQLYGDATDITIDGFECWGGQALLGTADGPSARARNVVLKNGIYHGSSLVYGASKIDGLVVDPSVSIEP